MLKKWTVCVFAAACAIGLVTIAARGLEKSPLEAVSDAVFSGLGKVFQK